MKTETPPELDCQRVMDLSCEILELIKTKYELGPEGSERVYEILNALAIATGFIIEGCDGPAGKAHQFFTQAFQNQVWGECK